ncbi:MAG: hypothetical protein EOP54_22785 [Sphingobacteriales bacterium]|nr:MAG: hypothetical protein EOP54_22785 [Sphingobacteriales bacterium]
MIIPLKNKEVSVSVDLKGGAIVDFHLHGNEVNPLTFKFALDQMPANNKGVAGYQGHFACIGRWGLPSEGEIKAGHPNHGQAAISQWKDLGHTESGLTMQVDTTLDGLRTTRVLKLSDNAAAFEVTETVKNVTHTGRFFNVVQHPTLAAPFLDARTRVDSSATFGINFNFDKAPLEFASEWPEGLCENGDRINLNTPDITCSSVFSFIVDKEATHGWVTAYSPASNLLIGYVWKREDYQFISLWQQFTGEEITYRGIEFGTTGIHKPFHEIIENDNTRLFGEKTLWHIDAGEEISRSYAAFLIQPGTGFAGVEAISVKNGNISVKPIQGELIELETGFKTI